MIISTPDLIDLGLADYLPASLSIPRFEEAWATREECYLGWSDGIPQGTQSTGTVITLTVSKGACSTGNVYGVQVLFRYGTGVVHL